MTGEGAKRSRYYTPNEGLVQKSFQVTSLMMPTVEILEIFWTEKVALHNTPNDLWVSFLGKVFDLTVLVENNKGPDIYLEPWLYQLKGSGSKNIQIRKWINCTNTSSSRPGHFSLVQQPDRRYKDTCRCRKGMSELGRSPTKSAEFWSNLFLGNNKILLSTWAISPCATSRTTIWLFNWFWAAMVEGCQVWGNKTP